MLRHVAQAFLDPGLAGLPGGAAKFIQLPTRLLRAVAGQHVDTLNRDKQLVSAEIEQPQTIMRRTADFQGFQSVILADSVLHMDHVIAFIQGGNFLQEFFAPASAPD